MGEDTDKKADPFELTRASVSAALEGVMGKIADAELLAEAHEKAQAAVSAAQTAAADAAQKTEAARAALDALNALLFAQNGAWPWMTFDQMGDAFKGAEDRGVLAPGAFVIRVDGKAFHTFTRGLDRPYDEGFARCMEAAATLLAKSVQGARLAYGQSDEISVICIPARDVSERWFGGKVQKIASVAAAIATAAFNRAMQEHLPDKVGKGLPLFDARCFALPVEMMPLYLIWRQDDAIRNAISMWAHAHASPKTLHGMNTRAQRALAEERSGVAYDALPEAQRRGFIVRRVERVVPTTGPYAKPGEVVARHAWEPAGAGSFRAEGYLGGLVPELAPFARVMPRPATATEDDGGDVQD